MQKKNGDCQELTANILMQSIDAVKLLLQAEIFLHKSWRCGIKRGEDRTRKV